VLLLFDIDGTLLGNAAGAHAQSLRKALVDVHGARVSEESRRRLDPAGRTDGEIARILLLDAGIDAREIDMRRSDVREACCREFLKLCPESLADRVLPGVAELLEWLSGLEGVHLSLVTGNFEPVARVKLKRAGLGHYFARGQGAFGSDFEDRTALPHIARKRAGHDGVAVPREDTIVIGDTPRDITCAQADGVRCLAVASGGYRPEELSEADAVAADAFELRPLLETALSGV
jgi:phosphoglycolate phosphatase-like HAD superfamily hydrolase